MGAKSSGEPDNAAKERLKVLIYNRLSVLERVQGIALKKATVIVSLVIDCQKITLIFM